MVEQDVHRVVPKRGRRVRCLLVAIIFTGLAAGVRADERGSSRGPAADPGEHDAVDSWLNNTVGAGGSEDRPVPRRESDRPVDKSGGRTHDGAGTMAGRMAWPLGIVLSLILLSAWAAKKWLRGARGHGGGGPIHVLARCSISPKQSLCLIRLGRRIILVGLTPDAMRPIVEIADPEECALLAAENEKGRSNSFTSAFARMAAGKPDEFAAAIEEPDEPEHPARGTGSAPFQYAASITNLPAESQDDELVVSAASCAGNRLAAGELAQTGRIVQDVVDRLRALSRGSVPAAGARDDELANRT